MRDVNVLSWRVTVRQKQIITLLLTERSAIYLKRLVRSGKMERATTCDGRGQMVKDSMGLYTPA
jgi:hypothetical protein